MSILIKNANVVNSDSVIKNTSIGIKDGIIDCIGNCDPNNYVTVIDAENKIVMPGLVNSHTHAGMTVFRNFVSDLPLTKWLFDKIIPNEAKLTKEDIYWGTMLAVAEMIKGGVTTFADMYYHMDEVAKVVQETGIRANISKSILSMQEGVSSIHKDMSKEREFFYKWNNSSNGRIKVYIEIHSAYMYDRRSLLLASGFAKELGTGIHIHVAETKDEQIMCYKKYNMDAVSILNECNVFDVPTLAVHCVHLSDDNINLLKEKDVNVSHNITSNLKLGSGIARIPDMIDKGINISLGTDGCASNDNLNLFEEMHLAALVHKGFLCDPTVLKVSDVLKMATENGAKALGFNNLGVIKEGNVADINCKDNKGRTLIQVVIDDTKIKDDDTEESLQSRKDKMIDFLYSKGINMDNASNDCTALQQACDSDDVELVRTLIKLDSKINLKNSKGNTALLSACHKNNYIVAKELLINKANVKISNLDGITPLHYAVKNGNLTLVKKLINIDKNIVNEKDKYGNTPLMYACYNEHFEIVKVLLDNNANPNIDNSNGETTIHIAFYKKDFAMLQLLINNGTDIDKQQGENKETVLHMACKDNLYTDYAIFLIRMGANVDIQTNTGWTPLHYACSNNNCRLAKYLIESGANVYTKTTENYSPLGICLKNKYYNISLWLIRSDIRLIYEKYDYNWELIHYAVKNNWLQLVEVLFKIGVDLEAKTRDNLTPIDIAKVSGNSSMLRFLNEKIKLKKNMGVSNNVRLKLKPSKTRVCVKSSNNNNRMLASQIKLTDASNRMVSLQNCENKIIKGSNINENKLISVYNMYSYNKNQNDNKLQYKNNSRSIGFYY